MLVGIDGRKIPEAAQRGPCGTLEHAKELGMDGVFFRTVLDMTPTLDAALLAEIRVMADDLGLYLEAGLGKVNPYALPEAPEIRRLGEGDTLLGFRRMIEACAAVGITELWSGTANRQPYPGYRSYDRFRTDVTWEDQLEATGRFLRKLAPIALANGVHINLETHEEMTSFETVRLVEVGGPDAFGIVLDTGNGLHRGEDPVEVAKRVAPYVRQTHLKDAILVIDERGVTLQARPIGEGIVDFAAILPVLIGAKPDIHLTMENRQPDGDAAASYPAFKVAKRPNVTGTLVQIYDPVWQAAHPDLTVGELASFTRLAAVGTGRVCRGETPGLADYAAADFGYDQAVEFIQQGARHLRRLLAGLGRDR